MNRMSSRIHLSTALLATFLAALLLLWNIREDASKHSYGWPVDYYPWFGATNGPPDSGDANPQVSVFFVVIDVVCCLTILATAIIASEFIILYRRMKREEVQERLDR